MTTTIFKHIAAALLLCAPLLAACNRQPPPPPSPSAAPAPTSALGGVVKKATDQALANLATSNISISDGFNVEINGRKIRRPGGKPKAEITPQGDLLIEDKAVAITPQHRTLLLQYRQHLIGIAAAGISIGLQGADLGMRTAGEALKGVLSGNTDQIEQRVEAQAAKIEAAADQLCDRLPALLATQQRLAAVLPEFKPYAGMDQSDIDSCGNNTSSGNATVRTLQRHEVREKIRSSVRAAVRGAVTNDAKVSPAADAAPDDSRPDDSLPQDSRLQDSVDR